MHWPFLGVKIENSPHVRIFFKINLAALSRGQ